MTAARILGLVVDGATPETIFKLTPEIALLIALAGGVLIEVRRQRRLSAA